MLNRTLTSHDRQRFSMIWHSVRTPMGMAYLSTNLKVWKSPTLLGAVSVGESEQWPEFYSPMLTSRGSSPVSSLPKTLSAKRIVNPFHISIGAFDFATFLIVLMPLVIIALTYDILSRDRELGTLRLLACQSSSSRLILMMRLLLRTWGVVVTIAVVFLADYFIVGADLSNSMVWKMLGLLLLGFIVYALLWAGLAWLINVFEWSSTTNGVLLAVSWMTIVFVSPLSVARSVAEAYPVPAAGALLTKEQEIQKSIKEMQAEELLHARRTHGETTPGSKGTYFAKLQELATEGARKLQDAMALEIGQFFQRHAEREAASRRWQSISPALAIKSLCDTIAGNSHHQAIRFTLQLQDDHRDYLEFFSTLSDGEGKLNPANVDRIATFSPSSSDLNVIAEGLWWPVAWGALWDGLIFLPGERPVVPQKLTVSHFRSKPSWQTGRMGSNHDGLKRTGWCGFISLARWRPSRLERIGLSTQ